MAKKVKKKKASKATSGKKSFFSLTAQGVERIEGEIKSTTSAGVFIVVKRPRSSKYELRFIPAEEVVAWAKGAGRKFPDVVYRRGAITVMEGQTSAFKASEGSLQVTLEGVTWHVNPHAVSITYKQEA